MNVPDLTSQPKSNPLSIYRYRDGLYAADLLTAAIVWLDFFTWLGKNPSDKLAICRHFEIQERPADVMLSLFAAMGYLEKQAGIFSLTETAREHLSEESPWFLGPYYASLKERPVCRDFLDVLRTDRPANWGSIKSEKDWVAAMQTPDFARNFTAAMDCRGVYLAQALARNLEPGSRKRLLDIAGGSGIYACSLVAHHPNLTATVLERPPVDEIARKSIAERGFADRVKVRAGDMFKEAIPSGFDLHLFSNVLHDWDVPLVRELLAKSFDALESGGLLLIHDVHLNDAKTGPLPAAAYSAMLMHSTPGRCYGRAEMFDFLLATGFTHPELKETAADRSVITATKA